MEFTAPNPGCVDVVDRRAELGVIEEVEELGAEIQAHLLREAERTSLMTEKSELTKSGPTTGTRAASPSSPDGAGADEARLR